jgi:adenosylmethionine-8-amino-7-oxononanoate aminotransferase
MDNGVYLRPLGQTIYILAPYVITDEELQTIYKAIKSALEVV